MAQPLRKNSNHQAQTPPPVLSACFPAFPPSLLSLRRPCLSSKDKNFSHIPDFISAPFLSFSFHVFLQSTLIACPGVLGYSKPADTVKQDWRIPSPHGFSILLCGLQGLFNFHLLFYLQYVLSVTLLFQLTDLFNSSSYLKCICLFCWPWRHVSPSPYVSSSRISCSFCFHFHYRFSLLNVQQFYFWSLY